MSTALSEEDLERSSMQEHSVPPCAQGPGPGPPCPTEAKEEMRLASDPLSRCAGCVRCWGVLPQQGALKSTCVQNRSSEPYENAPPSVEGTVPLVWTLHSLLRLYLCHTQAAASPFQSVTKISCILEFLYT